jgi:penicillin-binding protein 1A
MNGMYLGGRNIDGGTYPADIWGTYMKKAVGSFCGDFKRPTEPFHSQPFRGHYASQGGKDDDEKKSGDEQGAGIPEPGTETEPDNGGNAPDTNRGGNNGNGGNGDGNNGAAFDPNQYETPPQGEPQTGTPGGGTQAPTDG